jgi:hypothetical protein
MRFSLLCVAGTAAVVAAIAFAAFDVRTGLGALLGGLLATANLWIMARVAAAFIAQRGTTPWAAIAAIKLLVLLGAVWLVLKSGVVPPLSLVLGYASLPIGITVGSLFGPKPPETPPDEPSDAPPTHEGPPSE